MMNQNNDIIKMFACVQCAYKTVRKGDMTKHKKHVHDNYLKLNNLLVINVIQNLLQNFI